MRVDVRGLREAQAKIDQMIVDLYGEPMLDAMRQATVTISGTAKRLAPVDTGRLRASITPEVRLVGRDLEGVVGSNVTYAAPVETGSRPHWPPRAPIARWVQRKGLGISAFLVQRAIARRGTPAQPYLQPALEQHETDVLAQLERAVQRIIDK